ncbi:glucuronate isomerase, partial [bacterium]|nr:glucuronate isomerase [bacterium]
AIAADPSFDIRVLPTFRPDKGMAVENPAAFNAWVDRLGQAADVDVSSFSAYLDAIRKRHDFFHQTGCRLSDHGIETAYAEDYTDTQVAAVFAKIRSGKTLDAFEILQFKSAMLVEFGLMDAEKNWTYQLHLGALRNNNTRRFNEIGPDTGFDSIGDFEIARPLSSLLDRLDQRDALPKTILYNLNPADNAVMASMIGNFQDGSVPGKIQFGSGWWFNDTIRGMETQMDFLSEMGLLSRFVGMVTDSRSFLSYPRHEYFRRILCNLIGRDMADGLIPGDIELAGRMIADISYHNAANYFGFDLKPVPAS